MPIPEAPFFDDGREIATHVGDPELAAVAAQVIQAFDEQGIMAHGIKRAAAVGNVALEGVLNNCPDGGRMESFWTSGQRIFLSEGTPYHPMRTFDTTFFAYSNGAVALTSFATLEQHGIDVPATRRHATITLAQPVPAAAIELILPPHVLSVAAGRDPQEARAERQRLERSLLRELARIAHDGLTPGAVRSSH